VKLRSRTTSGVASPPTEAVAGTPRKADAPDIQAGAIVADHIAVDALDGKTITGGVLRTAPAGQRVVLTPDGPDADAEDGTSPAVVLYSGEALEQSPGILLARINPSSLQPTTVLSSPAAGFDDHDRPVDA